MANNAETPGPRAALLLTRPPADAQRFRDTLDPTLLAQTQVCLSPLIDIRPVAFDGDLSGYEGAIFSSSNAVGHVGPGGGRIAYCVGARTGDVASAMGWRVVATGPDADALVETLVRLRPSGRLVHLAGRHRRGRIAERLTDAGVPTDVRTVYEQVLLPLSGEAQALLAGKLPVIVPLFSPRTAMQFAAQAEGAGVLWIVAMSEAVAGALTDLPIRRLEIAASPTAEDMRRHVEMLLRQDSLG